MIGKGFLVLVVITSVLSTAACNASSENKGKGRAITSSANVILENAVKSTPFTAVVSHVDERRISGSHEDILVYRVQVEEVIRGSHLMTLTYEMVVEKGESSEMSSAPVIISLCHDEEGFFWPGTGSQFPVTSDLLATAKTAAQNVDMNQAAFDYCE